jgi:hypothetical protein
MYQENTVGGCAPCEKGAVGTFRMPAVFIIREADRHPEPVHHIHVRKCTAPEGERISRAGRGLIFL